MIEHLVIQMRVTKCLMLKRVAKHHSNENVLYDEIQKIKDYSKVVETTTNKKNRAI